MSSKKRKKRQVVNNNNRRPKPKVPFKISTVFLIFLICIIVGLIYYMISANIAGNFI